MSATEKLERLTAQGQSQAPRLGALWDSLRQVRERFGQVAGMVENLATLKTMGDENALIEMALIAQTQERLVETVWQAIVDCESQARQLGEARSETSQSETPIYPEVSDLLASATIPVASELDPDDTNPITQVDIERTLRVLVVDDEPAVLRAFGRVLSQQYEVLTARNGAEALKIVLAEDQIDAIVCDLDMPRLNGGSFFAELRELKPQMLNRVVFCTGTGSTDRGEKFLKGLDAPVLHKPVEAKALLSVVDAVRAH